jgi:hypothetical protein
LEERCLSIRLALVPKAETLKQLLKLARNT